MTILQKELTAMNKKVLIVSSSPRKHGNSDLLCDEFARGAKDAGNEVEKVFLADKKHKLLPRLRNMYLYA